MYKIRVAPGDLDRTIRMIQDNMAKKYYFRFHDFYAHIVRGDELIIVWKERVFRVSADPATWAEAVAYGSHWVLIKGSLTSNPSEYC